MQVNIPISEKEKEVFDAIVSEGGQLFFVGGIVRDTLLKRESKDIDVEVFHLSYDKLCEILSRFGYVETFGASFAVVHLDLLQHCEFALPRQEKSRGSGHQDFDIIIDSELPLEKAARRRDFTINAMMVDYKTKQLFDFFHGYDDLMDKRLEVIDEKSFQEDPLRLYRGASFISRFHLEASERTKTICKNMKEKVKYLSEERIYEEYVKILMGDFPSLGMTFLKDVGVLPSYLEALIHTHQRPDYHPEGNVWNHTMLVLDHAAEVKGETSWPLAFMWSALLHDIGKPLVTTEDGRAIGHHEAGVDVFKDVKIIKNKKLRVYVKMMILVHMELMKIFYDHSRPIVYKRLLKKIDGIFPLNDLVWFSRCDKAGTGRCAIQDMELINERLEEYVSSYGDHAQEALVSGKDLLALPIEDHRQYGDILRQAYEWQLQGMKKESILRRILHEFR